MDWIAGGWFLVSAAPMWRYALEGWPWPPPLVSDPFWTVSDCLCDIYPAVGPTWAGASDAELAAAAARLGVTRDGLHAVRREVDDLLARGALGWPYVFLDPGTARDFRRRHLARVPDVKLLAIATAPELAEALRREAAPAPGHGPGGVWEMVGRRQPLPGGGRALGFDVLGLDHGAFHSFVCNLLQVEYRDRLGLHLNAAGKLPAWEDAVRAA
ncbi:MAG TPA: hypothetical protein VFX28_13105, partial [Methylomirabilota bacterium]|nr:hypothetical protein [Methylomirabilota bacterium]